MSRQNPAEQIARAQAGDDEICGQIIEENAPLVWSVARRFFGRGVDPEDLFQLGCIGMLKAIRGYSADYGTMFSTYAVPKIAGEIRRFLRDDGLIKVSRQIKAESGKVAKAKETLSLRLGREPRLSEIAQETGLTAEEIAVCENAGTADSLQRVLADDGLTVEHALGVDSHEEEIVDRVLIDQAMDCLSELERRIIDLRFYRGMTQGRVAKLLGVSQVQISRLERRSIEKLRRKLGEKNG